MKHLRLINLMKLDPLVIVSATRTPIGSFQGALKQFSATQLGSHAIKSAIARANLSPENIDEVIMGCVLSAGLGQAPARQAALGAGLQPQTPCTTINKMCGSGMKSLMLAHDAIALGDQKIIIAGGMESMSNAPYILPKARSGYRIGHHSVIDHMFYDGLEDAYEKGKLMGYFAELCAQHYHFSRTDQDEFALRSFHRAVQANNDGTFIQEISPIHSGETLINMDEGIITAKPEKISKLRPAFSEQGTVTAANSSSISDGAAALILMKLSEAEARGLIPLAKIAAHCSYAQAPSWFTTAPIGVIKKLLDKLNWQINSVDLFEINEAFAVVTMAAIHELKLPVDKVNIHGGACVLGHPIGASGARIVVTLLNALQKYNLKRGIAALCIGGGEATAIAVERL